MKTKLLTMALLTTALSFSFAHGADKGGNGGGAHVCPDSVQMYDIYEGRARYDIDLVEDHSATEEELLEMALTKIKSSDARLLAKLIEAKLDYVNKNLRISKIKIKRVLDADDLFVDVGCSYEQLANWDDETGKIFVNELLWNRMTAYHRAAMKLHEASYAVAREYGEVKDSNLVRKFVASAFDQNDSEISNLYIVKRQYINGGVFFNGSFGIELVREKRKCDSDEYTVKIEYPGKGSFWLSGSSDFAKFEGKKLNSKNKIFETTYVRNKDNKDGDSLGLMFLQDLANDPTDPQGRLLYFTISVRNNGCGDTYEELSDLHVLGLREARIFHLSINSI